MLLGPERVAVLIEGAFSPAEHKLAQDQKGRDLLQKYAVELLHQISAELKDRIADTIHRPLGDSDVIANLETDQIMFIYSFEGDL